MHQLQKLLLPLHLQEFFLLNIVHLQNLWCIQFPYHLEDQKLDQLRGNTNYSIYKDIMVRGYVKTTISNGKFILKNGEFLGGTGQLLNKCGDYCESD